MTKSLETEETIWNHRSANERSRCSTKLRSSRRNWSTALPRAITPTLKKVGTLPAQLLFEIICSTYDVLFPVEHRKCYRFVKKFITRSNFDPDFAIFGGNICKDFPADLQYHYWGERLPLIGKVVTNPPPANNLVAWIKRHTHERNASTVALVGLFLAAFFGFLASAIGAAQLALSVLAWKRPGQPS